jgi:hypothetical protein
MRWLALTPVPELEELDVIDRYADGAAKPMHLEISIGDDAMDLARGYLPASCELFDGQEPAGTFAVRLTSGLHDDTPLLCAA